MKWLIKLYPKKWRYRYEDEFLFILENKKLSLADIVDIFINAVDARFLNLMEGFVQMDNKIRDVMLQSVAKRTLIIGIVIASGFLGGFWIASATPSILDLTPKLLLLIGLGLGIFLGFVFGYVRGIMRVYQVVKKEVIFLPTGKLKFDNSNR